MYRHRAGYRLYLYTYICISCSKTELHYLGRFMLLVSGLVEEGCVPAGRVVGAGMVLPGVRGVALFGLYWFAGCCAGTPGVPGTDGGVPYCCEGTAGCVDDGLVGNVEGCNDEGVVCEGVVDGVTGLTVGCEFDGVVGEGCGWGVVCWAYTLPIPNNKEPAIAVAIIVFICIFFLSERIFCPHRCNTHANRRLCAESHYGAKMCLNSPKFQMESLTHFFVSF